MSDAYRHDYASPRSDDALPSRPRRGLIALAVLLAFLAGLALAWWGMTRWKPGQALAPVAEAPRPAVAASLPAAAPQPAPAPAVDPALVLAREDLLAARLATIEARTAIVAADADAASGRAGRAEAMLLAAAARRAIDQGAGIGALEAPLRDRFGATQPRATQIVLAATHAPVTLETLRASFEALAPDIVSGGGDWWTSVRRSFGSLVVIHREGEPSPVPADRVARARRLLDEGQVEAAAAETARLPGAAFAGNWIAAAHRYAQVQRALDRLETVAIMGLAEPATGVTPAPAAPALAKPDPLASLQP